MVIGWKSARKPRAGDLYEQSAPGKARVLLGMDFRSSEEYGVCRVMRKS